MCSSTGIAIRWSLIVVVEISMYHICQSYFVLFSEKFVKDIRT